MLSKRIRISPPAMDGLAAHRSIYERGGILCGMENDGGTIEVMGVVSAPDSVIPSTHNFQFSSIPLDACAPAKVVGLFHTHPYNSGPSDVDRESSQRLNGIDCVVEDDGVFCYKGNDNLGFFRWKSTPKVRARAPLLPLPFSVQSYAESQIHHYYFLPEEAGFPQVITPSLSRGVLSLKRKRTRNS